MSSREQEHQQRQGLSRVALLVLSVLAFVVLSLFVWQQHRATGGVLGFPLDDSYIHLQFARNLAEAEGLSFRDGRPVAGSTAPLWTALLSLGFLVSLPFALFWSKLLGASLFVVSAFELRGLARQLGARASLGLLAGCLLLFTDTLAFSALSGMEVPLFIALTLRGMRCWVSEWESGLDSLVAPSLWMFAASVLARPEGLLLLALALSARLIRRLRRTRMTEFAREALVCVAMISIILLPTAGFFQLINGSPLPTTFAVKAGIGHRLLPSTRDVWSFVEVLFRVQPWMTFLSGAGLLALVLRRRPLLPALWFLSLPLAYSGLTPPGHTILLGNFGRYAFPMLPFAVLLGVLALEELLHGLEDCARSPAPSAPALSAPTPCAPTSFAPTVASASGGWHRLVGRDAVVTATKRLGTAALALVAVVLVVPSALATVRGAGRSAVAVGNVLESDVAAALYVAKELPDARIGAQDIGALGLYSDNEVVDLVGLVNPEILPYLRGAQQGSHPSGLAGLFEFVRRSEVDYLLLFPRSYGGLETMKSVAPGLVVTKRWTIERNVAMAADELVLIALPASSSPPRGALSGHK